MSQCNSPVCFKASSVFVLFCCHLSLFLMCYSLFNSNIDHFFSSLPTEKCQIPHKIICLFSSDPCSFFSISSSFLEWCWETITWTWCSNYTKLEPLCLQQCLSFPLCWANYELPARRQCTHHFIFRNRVCVWLSQVNCALLHFILSYLLPMPKEILVTGISRQGILIRLHGELN